MKILITISTNICITYQVLDSVNLDFCEYFIVILLDISNNFRMFFILLISNNSRTYNTLENFHRCSWKIFPMHRVTEWKYDKLKHNMHIYNTDVAIYFSFFLFHYWLSVHPTSRDSVRTCLLDFKILQSYWTIQV